MDDAPMPPTAPARPRRQFDSSRTRVGPVFGALATAATGDDQWVRRLLDLAAGPGPHAWHTQDLRVLERYHHAPPGADAPKEKGLAPLVTLLAWLVDNFTRPKDGKYQSGDFGDKRRELGERNPGVIAEARAALAKSRLGKAWYVLEGHTSPDVYLVTADALLVVEGKRTEAGPTTSTTWMAGRHQMLRFAAKDTRRDKAIRASLPHRSLADQEGIRTAMVGVTTWQRIASAFELPPSVLL